jgi:ABC-type multidrug transport system fused ATPase/permease subunit
MFITPIFSTKKSINDQMLFMNLYAVSTTSTIITNTINFLLFYFSGTIGARLSTDAMNLRRLVGDNLALNVQTVSTVISGFTIAVVANWKLALIITVVVPFVGFQGYAQMKFLKGLNRNAKVHAMDKSQMLFLQAFIVWQNIISNCLVGHS